MEYFQQPHHHHSEQICSSLYNALIIESDVVLVQARAILYKSVVGILGICANVPESK